MTAPTDFRAQRYAATKSAAWLAGYAAYDPWHWQTQVAPMSESDEFQRGWDRAADDYEFDREKCQPIHRRPSPMSSLERNRP